MQTTFLRKQRK